MDFLLQQASEDINEMNVIFITLHMFDRCFQFSTITGNGTNITATLMLFFELAKISDLKPSHTTTETTKNVVTHRKISVQIRIIMILQKVTSIMLA